MRFVGFGHNMAHTQNRRLHEMRRLWSNFGENETQRLFAYSVRFRWVRAISHSYRLCAANRRGQVTREGITWCEMFSTNRRNAGRDWPMK